MSNQGLAVNDSDNKQRHYTPIPHTTVPIVLASTHTLVLEQVTYVHNIHSNPWLTIHVTYTVEPLNNVTFGTSYSDHSREVAFFGGYKCVSTIGK